MSDSEKTEKVHRWMKDLPDNKKQIFAINWYIAHTLFNVSCKFYPNGESELQDIDWYKIYKSNDLGTWSHGGLVYVCSF